MTRRELVIRLMGWTIGIAVLAIVVRCADISGGLAIVIGVGPVVILGLLPYLAQVGLDARAWQGLLGALDHHVSWRRLLVARLGTDAPARAIAVPRPQANASVAIKHALLALAQSAYLLIAFLLGCTILAEHSQALVGSGAVPFLVAGGAVILLLVAANRLRGVLSTAGFDAQAFQRILDCPSAVAGGAVLLLLGSLVATFETWLLCHIVGIEITLTHALAMEAAVVCLRSVVFFVPAGLGVQDAGYLAFLSVFGFAPPQAAAFALLKRCKELVWMGAGYVLLLAIERRRRPSFVALGGAQ